MNSTKSELKKELADISILLGLVQTRPQARPAQLVGLLRDRLDAFYAAQGRTQDGAGLDARDIQRRTGIDALGALERIARLASVADSPPAQSSSSKAAAPPAPLFGSRDVKALGMLGGVIGRWALLEPEKPKKPTRRPAEEPRIVELEDSTESLTVENGSEGSLHDRGMAAMRVLRALRFKLDPKEQAPLRSSGDKELVAIVLPQLLGPLVRTLAEATAAVKDVSLSTPATAAIDEVFRSIQMTTVMSTLLSLLPSAPPNSALRRELSSQLCKQLVRPTGIRALLLVLVGTGAANGGSDDDVDIRKLEMIRRVVESRPQALAEEDYFRNVIDQLFAILRMAAEASIAATLTASAQAKGKASLAQPAPTNIPLPILRATCYLVAHLLVRPATSSSGRANVPHRIVREAMHDPLLPGAQPIRPADMSPDQLAVHLSVISLMSLYSPPLPDLLASLVRPILPPLLALLSHLSHPPLIIAEPSPRADALRGLVKDEANALAQTVAKGLDGPQAVAAFASAVERWEVGGAFGGKRADTADQILGGEDAGAVWRWRWSAEGLPMLRYVRADEADDAPPDMGFHGDEDADELMGAALSPVEIPSVVSLLNAIDRKELSVGLLLRWLDELKTLRSDASFTNGVSGAMRAVTRLQLILQMVEDLDAQEIVRDRPKEIIAFVAHAIDADGTVDAAAAPRETNESVADASITGDQEEGLGTGLGKDEMALTALTLLLAVLEADPTLDTSNTPLLAVIESQLDELSKASSSMLVPPLAREARMVLSLRRTSSAFDAANIAADDPTDAMAASRAKYREAIKLLQDPLLPVRAQGLTLLRSLVLDRTNSVLSTDPALLPAVLDIFVHAIEEEDSFLYLNAVQGLSSLVDVFGRQVIGRLLEVYTGAHKGDREPRAIDEGERGRRDLDKRLRVGETLVQVIQRAGEALALLVDDLVPPLLLVLRTPTLPVTLRASAITVTATALETAPAAIAPLAETLTEACVTLLNVETESLVPRKTVKTNGGSAPERDPTQPAKPSSSHVLIEEIDDSTEEGQELLDEEAEHATAANGSARKPEEMPDPTSTVSKHPTLRRAAAVFLATLIRTTIRIQREQLDKAQQAAWKSAEARLDGRGVDIRMPSDSASDSGGFLLRPGVQQAPHRQIGYISAEQLIRARTVLRYVSETDVDALVRDQTAQVLEELEQA